MATVNENIIARSDLDPNTDTRLQALIALAEERTYSACYSENVVNALIALRSLHWYTLGPDGLNSNSSGVVGAITSEREGDLARSFGNNFSFSSSEAYLSQTGYGLEILAIQKENIFQPRTRISQEKC